MDFNGQNFYGNLYSDIPVNFSFAQQGKDFGEYCFAFGNAILSCSFNVKQNNSRQVISNIVI